MTRNDAILLLVQAIEGIQLNWNQPGDLADAVREAIATKDEICQHFKLPTTDEILQEELES